LANRKSGQNRTRVTDTSHTFLPSSRQ